MKTHLEVFKYCIHYWHDVSSKRVYFFLLYIVSFDTVLFYVCSNHTRITNIMLNILSCHKNDILKKKKLCTLTAVCSSGKISKVDKNEFNITGYVPTSSKNDYFPLPFQLSKSPNLSFIVFQWKKGRSPKVIVHSNH